MGDLIEQIESYGFECEAGPLTTCADWTNLKAELEAKNKRIAELQNVLEAEIASNHRLAARELTLSLENERLRAALERIVSMDDMLNEAQMAVVAEDALAAAQGET